MKRKLSIIRFDSIRLLTEALETFDETSERIFDSVSFRDKSAVAIND